MKIPGKLNNITMTPRITEMICQIGKEDRHFIYTNI